MKWAVVTAGDRELWQGLDVEEVHHRWAQASIEGVRDLGHEAPAAIHRSEQHADNQSREADRRGASWLLLPLDAQVRDEPHGIAAADQVVDLQDFLVTEDGPSRAGRRRGSSALRNSRSVESTGRSGLLSKQRLDIRRRELLSQRAPGLARVALAVRTALAAPSVSR